jgi:hypothetical protein
MLRRLFPLLALLAVTAAAPARADPPAETPEARKQRIEAERKARAEADKKFAERVNRAIDAGHGWIKGQQRSDGTFRFATDDRQNLGRVALVLLTLAKCGSDKSDPEIVKGLVPLLELYEARQQANEWMTYSVATTILCLDAIYNPPPALSKDERYAAPVKKRCKYPKEVEERIREMVRWIVEKQSEFVWRYPGALGDGVAQDLSNTQYALLALQAAGRCGIEAPAGTYRRALEYLIATQEPDGPEEPRWIENPAYEPGGEDRYGPFLPAGKCKARGWRYFAQAGIAVTGSMTTAGVACLAIAKERLRALESLDAETTHKIDRSMEDGLAWLARNFAVDKNPGQGGWHYYYLYGLERVGAFTGLVHIGRHDWYRQGAEYLLGTQTTDGSWPGAGEHEEAIIQTCFALLFLKRATVPPALPLGPAITGGN